MERMTIKQKMVGILNCILIIWKSPLFWGCHVDFFLHYVIVNVQFEKGIRDIFVGVFVSSCVSNEKQTHPQKYL